MFLPSPEGFVGSLVPPGGCGKHTGRKKKGKDARPSECLWLLQVLLHGSHRKAVWLAQTFRFHHQPASAVFSPLQQPLGKPLRITPLISWLCQPYCSLWNAEAEEDTNIMSVEMRREGMSDSWDINYLPYLLTQMTSRGSQG